MVDLWLLTYMANSVPLGGMALVAVMIKTFMDNKDKFGQKKDPKDVKTQPQDEFITQTSNNLSQAANETPVHPGAAVPGDPEAREIDEEGLEQADKEARKNDTPKTGQ